MWTNHTVQKTSALLLKLMQAWESSQMFQPFKFILAVLQKQLSPDVNLREKMFQMKTICKSLNFESC